MSDGISKTPIWIGMFVGSTAGGYLPVLWGGEMFSYTGLLTSTIGGILGVFAGWWIANNLLG